MKISLSQISFTADHVFCAPEVYNQNKPPNYAAEHPETYDAFYKTQQEYGKAHPNEATWPWNIQSIRNETDLVPGKAIICTAGGITGVENHSNPGRYHFVSEQANIEALSLDDSPISLKLDKTIKAVNDKDLSVFVVGGEAVDTKFYYKSKKLFKSVINFFKRRGLDPTYFWGQNSLIDNRGVDAYYTSKDDTWWILKYKPGTNEIVSSIEDVQKVFSYSHLGKNDKLYFKDKTTPILPKVFNSKIKFKGNFIDKAA